MLGKDWMLEGQGRRSSGDEPLTRIARTCPSAPPLLKKVHSQTVDNFRGLAACARTRLAAAEAAAARPPAAVQRPGPAGPSSQRPPVHRRVHSAGAQPVARAAADSAEGAGRSADRPGQRAVGGSPPLVESAFRSAGRALGAVTGAPLLTLLLLMILLQSAALVALLPRAGLLPPLPTGLPRVRLHWQVDWPPFFPAERPPQASIRRSQPTSFASPAADMDDKLRRLSCRLSALEENASSEKSAN